MLPDSPEFTKRPMYCRTGIQDYVDLTQIYSRINTLLKYTAPALFRVCLFAPVRADSTAGNH